MDEEKVNGSWEMGVIIYGSFLMSNCHYGRGGGKLTRAWKHMQKWVKGGGVRAPTPIEAYVEAEGGIGIHVDPPITVVYLVLRRTLHVRLNTRYICAS